MAFEFKGGPPLKIALVPGNMRKGIGGVLKPGTRIPLVPGRRNQAAGVLPTINPLGTGTGLQKGKPVPWKNPDAAPSLGAGNKASIASFIDGAPSGRNEIDAIMSSFRSDKGYATPNRFEVSIFPPSKSGLANQSAAVQMRCEDVTLPGRNLNSKTDTLTYGPTREIVDGVTYAEDITLTFQASSGLEERVFFENWQERAFNQTTWDVGYYNKYTGTIEIYLLDKQNKKRYGIKLVEAFPKTIGPIPLSQSANNQIIKNTVTFSFRYWESLDTNRQNPHGTAPGFGSTNDFSLKLNIAGNTPSTVAKLATAGPAELGGQRRGGTGSGFQT
jgi:hypothetical protein